MAGKQIHIKGPGLNNFFARLMVDEHGEAARERCTGPMLKAVDAELERRASAQDEQEMPRD